MRRDSVAFETAFRYEIAQIPSDVISAGTDTHGNPTYDSSGY